jgi:hypothetical protein
MPDRAEMGYSQNNATAGVPSFLAAHIAQKQSAKARSPLVMNEADGVDAALKLISDNLDQNNSKLFGSEASLSNIDASQCSEPIQERKKTDLRKPSNRITEFITVSATK